MGGSLPASVTAMLQLAAGSPVSLRAITVLEVSDETVIDGLIQHPATAGLFLARLGPRALAVSVERVDAVTAALAELGTPAAAIRKSTP